MTSYDMWVTESLAKEAARPTPRRVMLDTVEFARFQFVADRANAETPSVAARFRHLRQNLAHTLRHPFGRE